MRGIVATGTVAALLALTGCSADEPADPVTSDAAESTGVPDTSGDIAPSTSDDARSTHVAPSTDDAPSTDVAPRAVDLSALDGALGEQARWVLDHLDPAATGPAASDVEERFHPDFRAEVPAEQIEPVLAQFREGPALTLTAVGPVQEQSDGVRSAELTLSGDQPLRMTLAVDADGLITGLLFRPGPPPDLPEVASWEELDEEFAALGGTTSLYVGEVADGSCTTTYGAGNEPAPSGSVFKLIVLSAVVDAVAAGDLAWDDELTITPERKSLPSGELQDRPDGDRVPVEEAAGLMISISDNTATDLLMDAVGPDRLRDAVERVTTDPDRLMPLLTTRQFFVLGWDAPELREQWAGSDTAERTAIVADLPDDLSALRGNPFAVTDPAWPDGVGWFLTGEEICAAHAVLQEQAQTEAGDPVRGILSANPGLAVPDGATYQGFKGGSAPGVLAYTFYVEAGDGPGRVLSVQVSHDGQILPTAYTELTQAGLAHLVEDGGG
ncbi:serine hydrolase [Ornithinimicrobium sp. F0845]|uniref:serine hydrolase n=1 Tax=Ornithinimicrobium sp. F0845 TaxID=2926412 RepID=UPI001FF31BFF|nr:serine hydrolase [Ornithinimicrobium sp. F0845]MCK0110891.1 serine hydrolase [Ornithinimicrobium sp. F0845]